MLICIETYKSKSIFKTNLVVIAGGTELSPARGIVDYFSNHPKEVNGMTLVAGF